MQVRDVEREVSAWTGRRPSPEGARSLRDWLLPKEPILAAVSGEYRGAGARETAHAVLTPPAILLVREYRGMSVVDPVPIQDATGYEIAPGWSGATLLLGTTMGPIELTGTDPRVAQQFCYSAERAISETDEFGIQLTLASVTRLLERCGGELERLDERRQLTGILGSKSSLEIVAADALSACRQASYNQPISYDMCSAMLLWHVIATGPAREPRGVLFKKVLAPADAAPLVIPAAMAPIADQIPADRNPAELLALAVLEFGRLVGAQSGDTMAPYRAAAASVRTTAGLMGSTFKVSGSTAPSTLDSNLTLVEQLERLRSLQQSGVLTHEEFESAKRRLLKG